METKRDLILSIVVSVLLHLVLLILLLFSKPEQEEQAQQETSETQYVNVELVSDATKDEEIKDVQEVDIALSSDDAAGKDCTVERSTYIGIGIIYSLMGNFIMNAPKEYPAGAAGIREGDILISSIDNNGYRDVTIDRDGEILKFHLKMQPICYSE